MYPVYMNATLFSIAAEECSFSSGSSFWAFLVVAAIFLVVVALVVGVVLIIVKKVKNRRGYTQIQ